MLNGNEMRKRNAFTLIELLVVIAIIALLLAILLPGLKKAKVIAKGLVCTSRLKDLGTMIELYAVDNDDRMPNSSSGHDYGYGRWWDLLGNYYGKIATGTGKGGSRYDTKIFRCPNEDKKDSAGSGMYGINIHFMCPVNTNGTRNTSDDTKSFPQFWWTKKSDISTPSTFPFFWDKNSDYDEYPRLGGNYGDPHGSLYKYGWYNGKIMSRRATAGGPAANHGRNINYMFADGHAGKMGLWPYEDTLRDPEKPEYYFKFFHPKRDLSIRP